MSVWHFGCIAVVIMGTRVLMCIGFLSSGFPLIQELTCEMTRRLWQCAALQWLDRWLALTGSEWIVWARVAMPSFVPQLVSQQRGRLQERTNQSYRDSPSRRTGWYYRASRGRCRKCVKRTGRVLADWSLAENLQCTSWPAASCMRTALLCILLVVFLLLQLAGLPITPAGGSAGFGREQLWVEVEGFARLLLTRQIAAERRLPFAAGNISRETAPKARDGRQRKEPRVRRR